MSWSSILFGLSFFILSCVLFVFFFGCDVSVCGVLFVVVFNFFFISRLLFSFFLFGGSDRCFVVVLFSSFFFSFLLGDFSFLLFWMFFGSWCLGGVFCFLCVVFDQFSLFSLVFCCGGFFC